MDPNATLKTLRDLLNYRNYTLTTKELETTTDAIIERITALDEWLSNGGFLPTDWERK